MEDVHRGHHQADENRQDEKDVEVLATIEFLDDDAGNGENVSHRLEDLE